MMKEKVIRAITEQAALPLFYHEDAEVSLQTIRALYAAGFRSVEYTNRGEPALDNFSIIHKAVKQEMPDLYLGAGTIHNRFQAAQFVAAGADYIVSPTAREEVGTFCADEDVLWIPGCFTPTEVALARENFAGIIKVFPASVLGPAFIKSIRSVFPEQLFMPTGGVDAESESLKEWFDAGVCAVGLGSNLVRGELLDQKDFLALTQLGQQLLARIKSCR